MDQRKYARHLSKIEHELPLRLRRFVHKFHLHDHRISHVQVIPAMPMGRDAFVVIQLFREGYRGTTALMTLHFIGLSGPIRNLPPRAAIMFFDVELLRGPWFRLSFALDEKKTWSVKFKDFDFYIHEYRKETHASGG